MDRLRELFTELGLRDVTTFIASGNVLFEAGSAKPEAIESKIERHLETSLGYEVETFLRTPEQIRALAKIDPFGTAERHGLYVGFLKSPPPSAACKKLFALGDPMHDFHITDREVYWLSRISMADTKVSNATIERTLGMPATFRSITTVTKLAAK